MSARTTRLCPEGENSGLNDLAMTQHVRDECSSKEASLAAQAIADRDGDKLSMPRCQDLGTRWVRSAFSPGPTYWPPSRGPRLAKPDARWRSEMVGFLTWHPSCLNPWPQFGLALAVHTIPDGCFYDTSHLLRQFDCLSHPPPSCSFAHENVDAETPCCFL